MPATTCDAKCSQAKGSTGRLSIVDGYIANVDRTPSFAKRHALLQKASLIVQYSDETCDTQWLDTFLLLLREIFDNDDGKSINYHSQRTSLFCRFTDRSDCHSSSNSIYLSTSDPEYFKTLSYAEVVSNRGVVAVVAIVHWDRVGGPDPYGDGVSLDVYASDTPLAWVQRVAKKTEELGEGSIAKVTVASPVPTWSTWARILHAIS